MLAINALSTESEKSEQKGFCNLLKGTFGMFRNTTAHAPRIYWKMSKKDAEDLLSMVSLMHRRIDAATTPSRYNPASCSFPLHSSRWTEVAEAERISRFFEECIQGRLLHCNRFRP